MSSKTHNEPCDGGENPVETRDVLESLKTRTAEEIALTLANNYGVTDLPGLDSDTEGAGFWVSDPEQLPTLDSLMETVDRVLKDTREELEGLKGLAIKVSGLKDGGMEDPELAELIEKERRLMKEEYYADMLQKERTEGLEIEDVAETRVAVEMLTNYGFYSNLTNDYYETPIEEPDNLHGVIIDERGFEGRTGPGGWGLAGRFREEYRFDKWDGENSKHTSITLFRYNPRTSPTNTGDGSERSDEGRRSAHFLVEYLETTGEGNGTATNYHTRFEIRATGDNRIYKQRNLSNEHQKFEVGDEKPAIVGLKELYTDMVQIRREVFAKNQEKIRQL